MNRAPMTKQRSPWVEQNPGTRLGGIQADTFARCVGDGTLWAIVAEEPLGWHLSISFRNHRNEQSRYPTWDEIADARDELLDADLDFVMWLPRAGNYLAINETFHLHEHPARTS